MENINLFKILIKDSELFLKSMEHLKEIFIDTKDIDLSLDLSKKEHYLLDTIGARFSRSFDLIDNKLFKTICAILGERVLTAMDIYNLMAKLEIIESNKDYYKMRLLRNKIVHEYAEDDWKVIMQDVLKFVPILLISSEKINNYILKLINDFDFEI